MARPKKSGLFYFPFDVEFFHDTRVRVLKIKFGAEGVFLYEYIPVSYTHLDVYKRQYTHSALQPACFISARACCICISLSTMHTGHS